MFPCTVYSARPESVPLFWDLVHHRAHAFNWREVRSKGFGGNTYLEKQRMHCQFCLANASSKPVQKNKRQKHGCGPMNLPAWLLTSCYVWYFLTNNIILYIIYSFTRRRAGSNTSKKWLPASHDFRYCCKNQALSGTLRHGRDFNFDRAQLVDLLECMNSKLHSPWFLRDLSYNAEISICVALRSRIYWI